MHYANMSDDEFLTLMRLGINTTLAQPAMLDLIATHGYDVPRLNAGLGLAENFAQRILDRIRTEGNKESATARLKTERREFHARTFHGQLSSVKKAFKGDPGFMDRLGVSGRLPKKFAPWLQGTKRFYDAILADPEVLAALAARGVTEQALQAARAKVLEIQGIDQEQEALKALVQQARLDRVASREVASDWYWEFVQHAKGAFRDHPEWLEMLGVKVRSNGRRKKPGDEPEA
jgi:hypothetical protein